MGHIDLILNSKSRTPTSSLIEPEWELDSRVPEGKLTVEQFNWNDVGYDLVGPEDYVLRVYADQYGYTLFKAFEKELKSTKKQKNTEIATLHKRIRRLEEQLVKQ